MPCIHSTNQWPLLTRGLLMMFTHQGEQRPVWSQAWGKRCWLDCALVLQPDNLNSYKLSQLSGVQLGTKSRETGNAGQGTPGEGVQALVFRRGIQLLAEAVQSPGRGAGGRADCTCIGSS